MGIYLNPGNAGFKRSVNSEIYIDKSLLIEQTNKAIFTEQCSVCVSRPRRFGKSMAANMLCAYYSRGCDSEELFSLLKISKETDFKKHLNQYNVIRLNMVELLADNTSVGEMLSDLETELTGELQEFYPDITTTGKITTTKLLKKIFAKYNIPFIFVIDEWDCILRSKKIFAGEQTEYLDYLRNLLKDQDYVALAYMTGILPIKKYGEHSALNMFMEYSMINQGNYASFTGFTEDEVEKLCEKFQISYERMKQWYNGYNVNGISIYNPKSVVEATLDNDFGNYWTKTETYEALKVYIEMDFDGLKEKVSRMLAGDRVRINPDKFQNDMTNLHTADDVLTLLVHLGYLTFERETNEVWIPNSEVQKEFINVLEDGGWEEIVEPIQMSDEILKMTLAGDEEGVAAAIRKVHRENTSILKYNDENSLSYVISYAYFTARKNYVMHRELSSGEGYSDIIFVPRKIADVKTPPLIVELKYDKSVTGAIDQIKKKVYMDCIKDYHGEMLLVGINYDKKEKTHQCKIERVEK